LNPGLVIEMKNSTLTPCEAEVMNVVWSRDSVTVQDVVDAIPRQLAYTTVMTTIRILEEKGFLKRAGKLGRALTYRPLVSNEVASRSTLNEMADRYFGGSVKSMVLCLIQSKKIGPDDLRELREVIDSLED
jgi:BlaI family penicillinase repressor